MIDYATWAAIGDGVAKHLTAAQRIRIDRAKPRSDPIVGRARGEPTGPPRKYVFGKSPG
jgi:hypothetical protein